jgi:hypothetical protein
VGAERRPKPAGGWCLVALLLTGVSADPAAQGPEGNPAAWTAAREAARRRVEIARMPSLRASAHATGGLYVVRLDVSCRWGSVTTIESLVRRSPIVVVGVLRSSQPVLSSDERAVHTVHEVEVAEALSGGLPRGARIAVTMPGGRVEFGGGVAAEVRTRAEPIVADLPHLFFLRPVEPTPASPRPAIERQAFQPAIAPFGGVYRLTSTVESLEGLDDPLRPAYQDTPPPLFLAAVREAVAAAGRHP